MIEKLKVILQTKHEITEIKDQKGFVDLGYSSVVARKIITVESQWDHLHSTTVWGSKKVNRVGQDSERSQIKDHLGDSLVIARYEIAHARVLERHVLASVETKDQTTIYKKDQRSSSPIDVGNARARCVHHAAVTLPHLESGHLQLRTTKINVKTTKIKDQTPNLEAELVLLSSPDVETLVVPSQLPEPAKKPYD